MWLWVSCARCFSKTLKLYDFICVPIGTDRLALYTGLLQQVCVSNYAYTGAKAVIFCYVLPRRAKKVSRPRLDRRTLPAGPREPPRRPGGNANGAYRTL